MMQQKINVLELQIRMLTEEVARIVNWLSSVEKITTGGLDKLQEQIKCTKEKD